MPVDVFISYRGADRMLARKLEQRLRSRWGSRVWRDESNLIDGNSWSDELRDIIRTAKVTLALIGPGWHIREDGEDWVRDELLGSIRAGKAVLPVLIGNSDELKSKLGELPEAFKLQAVEVGSDLAGFDLHTVEKALRRLGALGEHRDGGIGTDLFDGFPERCEQLTANLLGGQSVIVSGTSGSGRGALLRHMIDEVVKRGDLVATYGVNLSARSRRTHSVVASWIDAICSSLQVLAPEDRAALGPHLVKSVLDYGPDLLARQVLRPATLLPLGDDDSDKAILDAARRPTDKWAPFPPERLVSQSFRVITEFALAINKPLTLFADNVESIDGSSRNLVLRLLQSEPKNVRLALATAAVRESLESECAKVSMARALELASSDDIQKLDAFDSLSMHDNSTWGESGDIIKRWLDRHNVQLSDEISEKIIDTNPYYALSSLWYLVDHGHLVEPKPKPKALNQKSEPQSADDGLATWLTSGPIDDLEVPDRGRLLDHKIEEYIPARVRDILAAGALIGRRFPYSAAFAAAYPPETLDDQPPSEESIQRWTESADKWWDDLKGIDQDGAVFVWHYSADQERMINLAQVDLVSHLVNNMDQSTAQIYHERLAQYFREPLGSDSSSTLDDMYRDAQAAAAHSALADKPRDAADSERVAAEIAEKALAYPEARKHYQRAIRLLTQLLADKHYKSNVEHVVHQDLLVLANCNYSLGQMTRLANERDSVKDESSQPIKYLNRALDHLQNLTKILQNKRHAAPEVEMSYAVKQRNLPQPNTIRHHMRVCENISGWVNLELAQLYWFDAPKKSRGLLFDALRNAESARGEADSRWLLAAVSVQLAEKLVKDARQAHRRGRSVRSHNLAIEAQFHIERVIGLAAISVDEDRNLEETRSHAWTSLGRLFQSIELEPHLAGWAFKRMNDHKHEVSDLVDMLTDQRLGLYLLSTHCGKDNDQAKQARALLERHRHWVIESGIAHEHSDACLFLALLTLVEQSDSLPPKLDGARLLVKEAIRPDSNNHQNRNACLVLGLLDAIELAEDGPIAYADATVVADFRRAGLDGISSDSSDLDILLAGWKSLLIKLLRWCPYIEKEWIQIAICQQSSMMRTAPGSARHAFFKKLAQDSEVKQALENARTYLDRATSENLQPASDEMIWRLLECRVPTECYQHALRTRKLADQLLNQYSHEWQSDEDRLTLHRRNLAYAIAVHEWYRSTDPSRLLTLARESNLSIDGHAWASPKLLSGRLAIQVLDRQYGAEKEIGRQRLRQIESMVSNWAKGKKSAGALEKIFYIAVHQQEPHVRKAVPLWQAQANFNMTLEATYKAALKERDDLVSQAGLPLVQDLHLFDADAAVPDVGETSTHAFGPETDKNG